MTTADSTHHWHAHWIWDTDVSIDRNVNVQFRRSFTLPTALPAVRLHISADSRYLVFLNGERLGFGPARAYHFRYEYDTYEVTSYLKPGRNVIAVLVQQWGEATFQHLVGRGGLLVQLEEVATGDLLLGSDATWHARRSQAYRQNTPRIACQLPWEEQFDARLHEEGWQADTFDDSSWVSALEIGPVGVSPWGELSPRTIPFLTDEPVERAQIWSSGVFRRPEVVAAAHIAPYVIPGDLSANQHDIDTILATVLHVPNAGTVAFKMCRLYGIPPRLWIDGEELLLQPSAFDVEAARFLTEGEHLLLLDWQGHTHDKDVTITASGIQNLSVAPPPFLSQGASCIWAITVDPGAARSRIRAATTIDALQASTASWQSIAAIDTPPVDVYMDITAATPLNAKHEARALPLTIPPTSSQETQRFLVDFGREVIGWLEFEVEAAAGTVLDLLGFEGIQDGELKLTEMMNNSLRYTCRDGRQSYRSLLRRGFRYLLVSVHSGMSETIISCLKTSLATYPGEPRGSFACSDARLTEIWQMCAYTLRLCTEDTFTDCPAYEQTFWIGDSYIEAVVHAVVHGDMRIVERCMRLGADSLRQGVLANSQVPSGWDRIIPNWSWFWAFGCYEYYRTTGDLRFIHDLYPALKDQMDFLERSRNTQGLFEMRGAWHFLDWTGIDAGSDYIMAHENILACVVLEQTAELARAVGEVENAAHWLEIAGELRAAINNVFWSEAEQAYVDSIHEDGRLSTVVSQPTNACALFANLPRSPQREALLAKLLHSPEDWVKIGTPWMFSFFLEVLARENHVPEMVDLIRERWGAMLDKGATTAWESFPNGAEKSGAGNGPWTRSWCHAWSALPAYLLSTSVLGIHPQTPGFARVLIAPQLGNLNWVEGTMPTPRGDITLRAEKGDRELVLDVSLPPTIAGDVEFPLAQQGIVPDVSGALSKVELRGASWLVTLPEGAQARITLAQPM
jgi:alpha-L-rhamnosidase